MIQWIVFPWENPSEGVWVSSGQTAIQTLPSSRDRLCPHAGRAPYFLPKRRQEIWKRNAFCRGVAIPPHDSGKQPIRNTFSHRGKLSGKRHSVF